MSIIPATVEENTGTSKFEASSGKKLMRTYLKNKL
jgi:hypothetical protein